MSDDRKYRQRGYQDSGPRERTPQAPRKPIEPYDPRTPRDPRVPNMPGFREVFRCTKCGTDLHTCAQCTSFDGGSPLQCMQPIPAPVTPKDTRNACTFYTPRIKVER